MRDIIIAEVHDRVGLDGVLRDLQLGSGGPTQTFLIKPPWFSPHRANFVGARELDLLLSCLPAGRRIIIEGYSGARNYGGREITGENGRANWAWIKEQDQLFRDRTGINEVLKRHDAEYLNVTEEVWAGRAAAPEAVREAVAICYGDSRTVVQEELLGVVPQRLFDLRGSVLISFAKLKSGTWSLKNLFGLIPDPIRSRWHGPDGELLGRSIVDIAAVYRALFRVVGLVEGVYEGALYREGGRHHTEWGEYDIIENPGLILAGRPLVTLDACAAAALGADIAERSFARLGEAVFDEPAKVPPELGEALSCHARRLAAAPLS
ncbi:MAG: DUF362 domain-containing protein [Bacillota bacterium]